MRSLNVIRISTACLLLLDQISFALLPPNDKARLFLLMKGLGDMGACCEDAFRDELGVGRGLSPLEFCDWGAEAVWSGAAACMVDCI